MSNVTALKKETSPHAEAHRLRGVIARLNDEIMDAERVIRDAEAQSSHIAMQVLLGRATATDQEKHRRDVAHARDAVADKHAVLAAAKEELRRLEDAETQDKRAAAAIEARKLADQRIEAARKFDEAARAMQAAFIEFRMLGNAIPNTGAQLRISASNMSQWEAITGHHRVDGALPALVGVLHPNTIRAARIASLAESETTLWRALLSA